MPKPKKQIKEIKIDYTPRGHQKYIHSGMLGKRFSCIITHRRFGKTVCMINHLIMLSTQNMRKHPRPRYGYIAPFLSQAKSIAWDYLKHYTFNIPGIKVNESELKVELPNGAIIRLSGADSPDSLKGNYFDYVVVDETAQIKRDLWYEAIRPTISDEGINGGAAFVGTPKGIDNLLYDLNLESIEHTGDWFNIILPVDITGVINDDELEILRRQMPDSLFQQEYMCSFLASSEKVFIPLSLAIQATQQSLPPAAWNWAPRIFGIDVARYGDNKTVLCVRQGLKIMLIEELKQTDLMSLADIITSKIDLFLPQSTFIDEVGLGAGLLDRLNQLGYPVIGVNVGRKADDEEKYFNKRSEIWARLKQWLESGGELPSENKTLLKEITSLEYEYSLDRLKMESKDKLKSRGLNSPDWADALCLTFSSKVALDSPHKELTQAEKDWLIITGVTETAGNNYGEMFD